MIQYFLKILVSALVIATVSELAKIRPRLGAVILCLPLTTLIAYVGSHWSGAELTQLRIIAKDAVVLVPLTLLFYVPFLLPRVFPWGFWPLFSLGLALSATAVTAWLWITGALST